MNYKTVIPIYTDAEKYAHKTVKADKADKGDKADKSR